MTRKPRPVKSDIDRIMELCSGKELVFHNLIFDVSMLERIGCHFDWHTNSWDTSILSHILDSENHQKCLGKLKLLVEHHLGLPPEEEDELREATKSARRLAKNLGYAISSSDEKGSDAIAQDYWLPKLFADQHPEWEDVLARYANGDTLRTVGLFKAFKSVIDRWDPSDPRHRIVQRERDLTHVLYFMHKEGLYISRKRLKESIKENNAIVKPAIRTMQKIAGSDFNVESSQQIADVLFDDLELPVISTTATGSRSTDKHVRAELLSLPNKTTRQKRFVESWDRYKNAISSIKYLEGYKERLVGDHIYPSLVQPGTATTRLASRNPNGQNIKKEDKKDGVILKTGLRNVFGPKPGYEWFCFDYSQLQLRIFAYVTEEESMISAFDSGYDFHSFIASKIFRKEIDQISTHERRIGKNVNFGFIFGASPRKIELTAGVTGLWDTVCEMFPSAHRYMESVKSFVRKNGFVETPHGYRLYCSSPHKGVNYIVQGCEGDIVKEAMVLTDNYLSEQESNGFDGHILFTVHDEIIFQVKRKQKKTARVIPQLKRLMEQPGKDIGMVTPVDIEFTKDTWANVKDFSLWKLN